MKVELQYPVFVFIKSDLMVYVFHDDGQFKTTYMAYLKKTDFRNEVIIDSSGMKYYPQSAYQTQVWRFWERLLRRLLSLGSVKDITIEYEYKDAGTPVTLDELKTMIMERYPKSKWFSSVWSDYEEFQEEMDKSDTFEQVALHVGGNPPPKNKLSRILRGE